MTTFERPRGSGRWCAKYVLNYEQIWVEGSPFPSKSAAREAEKRDRDRRLARRTDETCASFSERWLEEWPRPSESTRRHYAHAVRRFGEQFGPTRLQEVERLSARTWALSVPRNVSKCIATMYEDARNIGIVTENPFSNMRLPVTEKTEEVYPPSLEEFRSLLNACITLGGYAQEFRSLLQFTAWSGLRAGEIQGLQWDDVEEKRVWIRRSRKSDGSLGPTKNKKVRWRPLPPPARVLDQVPRRYQSPFVFHSPQGKPLNKGTLYYTWRGVRNAAGIPVDRKHAGLPNLRFHDLRHFAATQALEHGADHFAVSVMLGHEDGGALVMARYGHPSRERAAERLLAAFGEEPEQTGSQPRSWQIESRHG